MYQEIYWKKALEKTYKCVNSGDVIPLKTTDITNTIYKKTDFIIRKLNTKKFKKNKFIGPSLNPFDPYETALVVDKIGENHHLILNKYPVQVGHILLITNSWKPQVGWLEKDDWNAIKSVNDDTSGLWFFNSGPLAGASQPHRHIQLLRRRSEEVSCPREDWFLNLAGNSNGNEKLGERTIAKAFNINNESINLYDVYIELADKIGLGNPEIDYVPKYPYNMLLTNNWIALIRRERDYVHGFSINSLGFAGYILVTEKSDYNYLAKNGPEKLLENFV